MIPCYLEKHAQNGARPRRHYLARSFCFGGADTRPFALFALFALLVSQLSSQQTPTFSSTANVVVVDVTVTSRDGKPLTNLTKNDFLVYEDGKLQTLQGCDLTEAGYQAARADAASQDLCKFARRPKPAPAAPALCARGHRRRSRN